MALSYCFFLMLRPFARLSILAPKRAVAATAYLSRGLFLSLTDLILKAILLTALSSAYVSFPAKRRPILPVIAGASTVSETTATGVNYFKTGEDPPLKADSEYPDWLWTIPEPPLSLFTLERKYSDDDALTDGNYEDVSCLRPSPFRAPHPYPDISY